MTIDAFELIAPQLRSIALSKAVAMDLDYDEQQDIAQETLLRLWQMRDDNRKLASRLVFAWWWASATRCCHLMARVSLPLHRLSMWLLPMPLLPVSIPLTRLTTT